MRRIAEGSQASVYLARHKLIKRQVAIKILQPVMAADPDLVRRFLDEAQIVGTMGHPHVVESLDMGVTPEGRPYIVLEYLDGNTVSQELQGGAFDVGRAAYIAKQVASALHAAHLRGIVHRDLKPDNVFLIVEKSRGDQVKVIDFGISKLDAANGGLGEAKSDLMFGTPEYMAPEQITHGSDVDARADVYALGAMLYEMLVGKTPFEGEPYPEILDSVVHTPPSPIAERRPGLPAALSALVDRCLEKRPQERYASMEEVEAALEPFAEEPPLVTKSSRIEPTAAVRSPTSHGSIRNVPPSLSNATRPRPWATRLFAGVVALAAVAGGVTLWLHRGQAPAEQAPVTSRSPEATATAAEEPSALPPTAAATTANPEAPPSYVAAAAPAPAIGVAVGSGRPTARSAPGLRGTAPLATNARAPADTAAAAAPVDPPPTAAVPPPGTTPAAPATIAAAAAAPTAPVPPPTSSTPPGTIEPHAVGAAIRAHSAEVQSCFDRARMNSADLRGRVGVRATIDPTGAVANVGVASSSAHDARLENCLVGAFRTWRFPAPSGGVAGSVSYTFVFE